MPVKPLDYASPEKVATPRLRRGDWASLAVGAATCWAVRALYLWATRHTRFPPPWYEPVAPWLLGSFILLIVVGLLMAPRWPVLGKASAGACFMGILLGGYACVTDHSQG